MPVSFAINSVLQGEMTAGVHAAPHDPQILASWLDQVKGLAQYMERVDHLI
jgi:saccharopine dehydrogenase (NADP+, L-glutamate forming)